MYTCRLFLLFLFLKQIYCSTISFSSPTPNSEIVAGSTLSFHWADHDNSALPFNIYLMEHQTAFMHQLAYNIDSSLSSTQVSIPNLKSHQYTIIVTDATTKSLITTIGPVYLVQEQGTHQNVIHTHTDTVYDVYYETGITLTSGQVVVISFSIIGIVLIFWAVLYTFTKIEHDIENIQYVLLEKL